MKESLKYSNATTDRLPVVLDTLTRSIDAIGRERRHFAWQAQWLKRLNTFLNVSIVLLGVAAPAMVTYMTQQPFLDPGTQLRTIIVVGLAGTLAILRIVLNWGEKYGYAVMTAMKLREIEANARLEKEEILLSGNEKMMVSRLAALNRDIQVQWTEAVLRHLASGGNTAEGE